MTSEEKLVGLIKRITDNGKDGSFEVLNLDGYAEIKFFDDQSEFLGEVKFGRIWDIENVDDFIGLIIGGIKKDGT